MKHIKSYTNFNEAVGSVGAIVGGRHKSESKPEAEKSDKPDEILLSLRTSQSLNKWRKFNGKLVDVSFKKAEEKKGFFSKLFSEDSWLVFEFDCNLKGDEKVAAYMKYKKGKLEYTDASDFKGGDSSIICNIIDSDGDKFIKNLMSSKWAPELKKTFQNIESELKELFSS